MITNMHDSTTTRLLHSYSYKELLLLHVLHDYMHDMHLLLSGAPCGMQCNFEQLVVLVETKLLDNTVFL